MIFIDYKNYVYYQPEYHLNDFIMFKMSKQHKTINEYGTPYTLMIDSTYKHNRYIFPYYLVG